MQYEREKVEENNVFLHFLSNNDRAVIHSRSG